MNQILNHIFNHSMLILLSKLAAGLALLCCGCTHTKAPIRPVAEREASSTRVSAAAVQEARREAVAARKHAESVHGDVAAIRKEIEATHKEICSTRVAIANLEAKLSLPAEAGWTPSVDVPAKPRKVDKRFPIILVTSIPVGQPEGWYCEGCERAKKDLIPNSKRFSVTVKIFDKLATPRFLSLPGWIWRDAAGRQHTAVGYTTEEDLWQRVQATLVPRGIDT